MTFSLMFYEPYMATSAAVNNVNYLGGVFFPVDLCAQLRQVPEPRPGLCLKTPTHICLNISLWPICNTAVPLPLLSHSYTHQMKRNVIFKGIVCRVLWCNNYVFMTGEGFFFVFFKKQVSLE